jgi:hypothetical protein
VGHALLANLYFFGGGELLVRLLELLGMQLFRLPSGCFPSLQYYLQDLTPWFFAATSEGCSSLMAEVRSHLLALEGVFF